MLQCTLARGVGGFAPTSRRNGAELIWDRPPVLDLRYILTACSADPELGNDACTIG
jgi:hypothetical protein